MPKFKLLHQEKQGVRDLGEIGENIYLALQHVYAAGHKKGGGYSPEKFLIISSDLDVWNIDALIDHAYEQYQKDKQNKRKVDDWTILFMDNLEDIKKKERKQ